jgi:membrane-bound ClpP family serine protease
MPIVWIIALIALAIILLVIELLIIPGISFAGIGAFVLFVLGISIAYTKLGSQGGNITLLVSLLLVVATIYFALKPNTWKRVALKATIDGKAGNVEETNTLKVGDTGIAKSRLAPMGEIEVNGIIAEAQSEGEYINPGTQIEIIRTEKSKIIIKTRQL